MTLAQTFKKALLQGNVCLHPTDSLPGLTFNPQIPDALRRLKAVKGERSNAKGFVSLVASMNEAMKYWQPLPAGWDKVLNDFWPGPFTFIWHSLASSPPCVRNEDGTMAIRNPKLADDHGWLYEVMENLPFPIPSTSVNRQGEKPKDTLVEAQDFLKGKDHTFFDLEGTALPPGQPRPSTLVKITGHKSFEILRCQPGEAAGIKQKIRNLLGDGPT